MMFTINTLQRATHSFTTRQFVARPAQPLPPHRPPPPQLDITPPFSDMGDGSKDKGDVHSEETILFLFLTFGILIVLILIFLLLGFQTYLSWRIAGELVGADTELAVDKDFRRWDRERKERKKALRALEKSRSVRASWGYGSGNRSSGKDDEEMGMSGARGSSVMLDKMALKEEKKPFWSVKRWL